MTTRTLTVQTASSVTYLTGTVNGEECTWQMIAAGQWQTTATRATDDIYYLELQAVETSGAAYTLSTTIYYGLHLITDRTKADVDRLEALMTKGWDKLTADEQQEYLEASHKGAYNASDLNRVGAAVNYVAELLAEYAYNVQINARVDWTRESDFRMGDLLSYLADVERLRAGLAHFAATPETPDNIKTPEEANAVEQIILDVYELLQNMLAAFFYCGEPYSGEM